MNYKITQVVILLFLIEGYGFSQNNLNADNFYIIDPLTIERISEQERMMVDSTLELFHKTEVDTSKLWLVNHLVDNCIENDVWSEFNDFMLHYSVSLLKQCSSYKPLKWQLVVSKYIALSLNNKGVLSFYQGKLDASLDYYYKSLDINEAIQDEEGMAGCYNNIGSIYYNQNDLDESLKYFKKSISLKNKNLNPISYANALNNIGSIYNAKGILDSAEIYFNKSLYLNNVYKDQSGKASCYLNIGSIQSKRGNYGLANLFLLKSIRVNEKLQDYKMVASAYYLLSKLHLIQKNVELAKTYAERSFQLATKIGYPEEIKDASLLLNNIYRGENNYKQALEFMDLHVLMKDSIESDRVKKDLKNRQLSYEYEKKALADSLNFARENMYNLKEMAEKDAKIKQDRVVRIILLLGFVLMISIIIFIYVTLKKIRLANERIEIEKANVEEQRDLLNQQYLLTENQSNLLKFKNREITDSIIYAKRLQEAILPSNQKLEERLNDGFILFKPKDIVAGDFYWVDKKDEVTYFAVADCTGHGVPGALVSIVCINALNSVMLQFPKPKPNQILDAITQIIANVFDSKKHQINDGMDIALCAWDKSTDMLYYSGAFNPLWLVSDRPDVGVESRITKQEDQDVYLHEIAGTRRPVGYYHEMMPFDMRQVQLNKGDRIYLITDGYADQFGGEKGKKFKYKQLKELVLDSLKEDMNEQCLFLEKEYYNWKGDLEQIDDVCIMGIRI
jgi:serine phosphatase RsbU (regulator of sigma subunit)/tetratricopeptide (TPR) repeat protein